MKTLVKPRVHHREDLNNPARKFSLKLVAILNRDLRIVCEYQTGLN